MTLLRARARGAVTALVGIVVAGLVLSTTGVPVAADSVGVGPSDGDYSGANFGSPGEHEVCEDSDGWPEGVRGVGEVSRKEVNDLSPECFRGTVSWPPSGASNAICEDVVGYQVFRFYGTRGNPVGVTTMSFAWIPNPCGGSFPTILNLGFNIPQADRNEPGVLMFFPHPDDGVFGQAPGMLDANGRVATRYLWRWMRWQLTVRESSWRNWDAVWDDRDDLHPTARSDWGHGMVSTEPPVYQEVGGGPSPAQGCRYYQRRDPVMDLVTGQGIVDTSGKRWWLAPGDDAARYGMRNQIYSDYKNLGWPAFGTRAVASPAYNFTVRLQPGDSRRPVRPAFSAWDLYHKDRSGKWRDDGNWLYRPGEGDGYGCSSPMDFSVVSRTSGDQVVLGTCWAPITTRFVNYRHRNDPDPNVIFERSSHWSREWYGPASTQNLGASPTHTAYRAKIQDLLGRFADNPAFWQWLAFPEYQQRTPGNASSRAAATQAVSQAVNSLRCASTVAPLVRLGADVTVPPPDPVPTMVASGPTSTPARGAEAPARFTWRVTGWTNCGANPCEVLGTPDWRVEAIDDRGRVVSTLRECATATSSGCDYRVAREGVDADKQGFWVEMHFYTPAPAGTRIRVVPTGTLPVRQKRQAYTEATLEIPARYLDSPTRGRLQITSGTPFNLQLYPNPDGSGAAGTLTRNITVNYPSWDSDLTGGVIDPTTN